MKNKKVNRKPLYVLRYPTLHSQVHNSDSLTFWVKGFERCSIHERERESTHDGLAAAAAVCSFVRSRVLRARRRWRPRRTGPRCRDRPGPLTYITRRVQVPHIRESRPTSSSSNGYLTASRGVMVPLVLSANERASKQVLCVASLYTLPRLRLSFLLHLCAFPTALLLLATLTDLTDDSLACAVCLCCPFSCRRLLVVVVVWWWCMVYAVAFVGK